MTEKELKKRHSDFIDFAKQQGPDHHDKIMELLTGKPAAVHFERFISGLEQSLGLEQSK